MTFKLKRKKKIEKLLNKNMVVTIEDLKNTLNTDFSKTIFRYLKEIGYLTSYNNAGRFYTLPHTPKFDEYGHGIMKWPPSLNLGHLNRQYVP